MRGSVGVQLSRKKITAHVILIRRCTQDLQNMFGCRGAVTINFSLPFMTIMHELKDHAFIFRGPTDREGSFKMFVGAPWEIITFWEYPVYGTMGAVPRLFPSIPFSLIHSSHSFNVGERSRPTWFYFCQGSSIFDVILKPAFVTTHNIQGDQWGSANSAFSLYSTTTMYNVQVTACKVLRTIYALMKDLPRNNTLEIIPSLMPPNWTDTLC